MTSEISQCGASLRYMFLLVRLATNVRVPKATSQTMQSGKCWLAAGSGWSQNEHAKPEHHQSLQIYVLHISGPLPSKLRTQLYHWLLSMLWLRLAS